MSHLAIKAQIKLSHSCYSGLDACSAHQVLMHLRGLAHRDRRNIVCSIHQPGSRLFQVRTNPSEKCEPVTYSGVLQQAFDAVLVLAPGGRCLVRGPREDLVPLLAERGFQCPPFYNPADYGNHLTIVTNNKSIFKYYFPCSSGGGYW